MRHTLIFALIPFILLSACGRNDEARDEKRSAAKDSDTSGTVSIKADSEKGQVAVKIPGFEAKFSVPKSALDQSNFDIDGVKLYPGSKVSSININADKTGQGKAATINVAFVAPADQAAVRNYFEKAFAENEITLTPSDNGLSGKTEDGQSFTISLAPGVTGSTNGKIVIVDKDGSKT